MSQRTLEVLSAIGLVVFLLCVCMSARCSTAPVLPALERIEEIKKDGTLDPLPALNRQKVVAVLEKSAASESQAITRAEKAEARSGRISLLAAGLGGSAATLFLLFFFFLRRKINPG